MKRILAFILSVVIVSAFAGCENSVPISEEQNMEIQSEFPVGDCQPDSKDIFQHIPYTVQYIRTDGDIQEWTAFPKIGIIRSLNELKNYYENKKDTYYLEGSEYHTGFLDACEEYDEAFFEENFLVYVILQEGSGSVSHEIYDIGQTAEKKLSISIVRNVPEIGTSDMATWHIILGINKDAEVESTDDVLLYLDGELSWDGRPVITPSEPAFKEPPKGTLITPDDSIVLYTGGYHWFYPTGNDVTAAVIADQAGRPLPKECIKPITIAYKADDEFGYAAKLAWEKNPDSVVCTYWPDTVWQDSSVRSTEFPVGENDLFYAQPGGYIYEFYVTWKDTGDGCYGSAYYYVYIIGDSSTEFYTIF